MRHSHSAGLPRPVPHQVPKGLWKPPFFDVRTADLIVMLDGARFVEVGTHDALMAKDSQYSELSGVRRPLTADRLVIDHKSV